MLLIRFVSRHQAHALSIAAKGFEGGEIELGPQYAGTIKDTLDAIHVGPMRWIDDRGCGILLALSTTIVGGIGGYLMRLVKSLALGQQLAALYLQESQRPAEANLAALQRIEGLLQEPGANAAAGRQ